MRRRAGLLLAALAAAPAQAQLELDRAPYRLVVEAYANATGDFASERADARDGDRADGLLDAELRVLGLHRFAEGWALGPRVTARGDSRDGRALGESSALLLTPAGRFEAGARRGLPDVLTGYAPNAYQFVSAEFGPASGRSLDPDGGLQTFFLEPALGGQIAALASLGITSSLFADQSDKLLWVSPRRGGFLGGLSYAPEVQDDPRFDDLTQAGLVYERYGETTTARLGGSYSHASRGVAHEALDSVGLGGNLVMHDALTLGVSGTWDGDGGLPTAAPFADAAWGAAASANYNHGPWTVGGFVQHARGAGDAFVAGRDELHAAELGLSYRTHPRLRFYGAVYAYRLDDETAARFVGAVLLAGTRITL